VSADFLVEIGTEELPPLALPELESAFAEGVRTGLAGASLAHGSIESFATPRRLAVLVRELAARQPDQEVKRRGPPVSAAFDASGAPTRAATAFAESCGVAVEQLARVREGKGEFLFHAGMKRGAPAGELVPAIVRGSLDRLPIPRRMRWGAGDAEFVRPVHWVVMIFGSEVVPTTLLDTAAGNATRGHRFHAPDPIPIATPADYAKLLRERGWVIASFEERRARVREQVNAKAAGLGGRAVTSEELLDEVTALVEWPVAVAGRFEERFLALPREVLLSTLQEHQRYFAIEDARGALTSWFITISNIESREPQEVREGNERVVRPRLADAAFFWEQDRKRPLASLRPALDEVTFQAKLGSIGAKIERIRALARIVATDIGGDPALAERTATLCKCDLLTAMVGEFPELQGVMGRYYARADGEPAEVSEAIREHYLPRGAGDELPATRTGMAIALADKLDTLAGIFAIGQKPSGTKDPFGLRRAAIGVLRIVLERRLSLDIRALIDGAVAAQPVSAPQAAGEVYDYVMERLRAYYLERGQALEGDRGVEVTPEMYDAVLTVRPRSPLDFDARLRALAEFLQRPEAASLASANKRTANILKKADPREDSLVDEGRLIEPSEKQLAQKMRELGTQARQLTGRGEYGSALATLAGLRPQVDAFFDDVMVMADDPTLRANRLALLAELRALFGEIADLSRLPG
jgi:glycyl-tRNA synthetase beta chain